MYRLRLLLACTVAGALVACSGSDGTLDGPPSDEVVAPSDDVETPTSDQNKAPEPGSPADTEPPTPDPQVETDPSPAGSEELVPGDSVDPMREVFGVLTLAEQNVVMEEVIATCMIGQGFTYVARADPNETFDDRALDSREWAQAWGFGIATRYTEAVLADRDTTRRERDANADAVSDGERVARDAALKQCRNRGFDEIARRFETYNAFSDDLRELYEAVEADSRVVAAHQDWVECLTTAGWAVANEDAARDLIREPMSDIISRGRTDLPTAPTDEERDAWDGVTFNADGAIVPPLTDAAEDELAVLAEQERLLAVAVWDCSAELETAIKPVRAEYEHQYLAANENKVRESLSEP